MAFFQGWSPRKHVGDYDAGSRLAATSGDCDTGARLAAAPECDDSYCSFGRGGAF